MTNSKQAFPEITVICRDRPRIFCLNIGAFRALEEHMSSKPEVIKEYGDKYSVFKHFPWASEKAKDVSLLMWAGFSVDAQADKDPWTVEKSDAVVSVLSLGQMRACIEESLSRAISPEQAEKIAFDSEKKTPAKRGRKPKGQA